MLWMSFISIVITLGKEIWTESFFSVSLLNVTQLAHIHIAYYPTLFELCYEIWKRAARIMHHLGFLGENICHRS